MQPLGDFAAKKRDVPNDPIRLAHQLVIDFARNDVRHDEAFRPRFVKPSTIGERRNEGLSGLDCNFDVVLVNHEVRCNSGLVGGLFEQAHAPASQGQEDVHLRLKLPVPIPGFSNQCAGKFRACFNFSGGNEALGPEQRHVPP